MNRNRRYSSKYQGEPQYYTSSVSETGEDYDDNMNQHSDSDENFSENDVCIMAGSDVSDKSESDGSSDNKNDPNDDNRLSQSSSGIEMWSGSTLKPNLPDFDGILCLSDDILPQLPKNPSIIDLFHLFLTPEITNYIVDRSNLYRTQNHLTKQSPMTEDDFYLLLGFLYYSSIMALSSKSDYWSVTCRQPIVADTITRNRIDYLLSVLHLNDNTIEQNKGQKIESLIQLFNRRCLSFVDPEVNVSIDEQMIGYKGKCAPKSFKQYMPNKPTRRGYKFWARCDMSGFVYEVKFYQGSQRIAANKSPAMSLARTLRSTTNTVTRDQNIQDEAAKRTANAKMLGSSGMAVLDFLEHIPAGSRIFVNNYLASYNPMKKMTDLGYGITCTLRQNRIKSCPLPTEKRVKKKLRGYYESFINDDENCVVVIWKHKKRVILGSNCIGVDPVIMVRRWNKEEGNYQQVPAPQIVSYYNKYMRGVDTVDMMIALHPIPFRSKKIGIHVSSGEFSI